MRASTPADMFKVRSFSALSITYYPRCDVTAEVLAENKSKARQEWHGMMIIGTSGHGIERARPIDVLGSQHSEAVSWQSSIIGLFLARCQETANGKLLCLMQVDGLGRRLRHQPLLHWHDQSGQSLFLSFGGFC